MAQGRGVDSGKVVGGRIPCAHSNRRVLTGILEGVEDARLARAPEAAEDSGSSAEVASFAEAQGRRLVARAQAGDAAAFELLYRDNVGRIFALCRRLCGDEAEAEEMTQESFVRAFERLDLFRGDSAFSTWLHRLAVNVVLGKWRGNSRYRQRVLPIEDFEAFEALMPPTKDGAAAIDLERAIRLLPKGARTIFVLHDIEGHLHSEIAELTGLAIGTCKAQLHRARRLLREALGYGQDHLAS